MRNPQYETAGLKRASVKGPSPSGEGLGWGPSPTSANDAETQTPPPAPPLKGRGDSPERRCIITGDHGPREWLIRLALGPDGMLAPDVRARAPGRGAWIGVDRTGLETAMAKGKFKGALARAFKGQAAGYPDDLPERIAQQLERTALDRLGLEARGGTLLTGSDRIEEAARRGQVIMLLHAADASEHGARKLAQAWRVGSDREGSSDSGIMLAANRAQLSAALGRENCVHIAVTDKGAATRLDLALGRWHRFIGCDWPAGLAESPASVQRSAAHELLQEDGFNQ